MLKHQYGKIVNYMQAREKPLFKWQKTCTLQEESVNAVFFHNENMKIPYRPIIMFTIFCHAPLIL